MKSKIIVGIGLIFAGSLLSGCAARQDRAMALVKIRGESDLECPQSDLMVNSTWGGRYIVSGCGRTATYDSVCEGLRCEVTREGEEAPAWRGRPDPGDNYRP